MALLSPLHEAASKDKLHSHYWVSIVVCSYLLYLVEWSEHNSHLG